LRGAKTLIFQGCARTTQGCGGFSALWSGARTLSGPNQ
jgi:hypothetical protein